MGNKVRIGMIGLGARGKGLLETAYLEHPDAEFVVVCDKYEDRCQEAAKVIEKSGRNTPKMVTELDVCSFLFPTFLFLSV